MKVYNEVEQAFIDGHDSRDEEVSDLELEIKDLKVKLSEYKDSVKLEKQNCMFRKALEKIIVLSIFSDNHQEKISLIAKEALKGSEE